MNNEFIKYHAGSDTYIVQKKAYFEDAVVIDGNAMVGAGANFWDGLTVKGSLELGKGSFVKGDVKAESAIIGSRTEITGRVDVENDLTLLDEVAITGSAICGGEMLVRPGCSMAFAKANATLELIGKVDIKEIETGTKVIVRSD